MSADELQQMMDQANRLQSEIRRAHRRTERSLAKLAVSQALTEVNFNRMMITIGKYFSEKNCGNHPGRETN